MAARPRQHEDARPGPAPAPALGPSLHAYARLHRCATGHRHASPAREAVTGRTGRSLRSAPVVTVRRQWDGGDPELVAWVSSPRNDLVLETEVEHGRFEQVDGPFRRYERQVTQHTDGALHEVTKYQVTVPWFGWLFAPFVRHTIRNRPAPGERTGGEQPWWAPPDRLDTRQVLVLGLLAAASLCAAFVNTLFTQTVNFAAKDFGVDNSGQAVAGTVVRAGIIIALPVALLADRVGRRRMIQFCAFTAPVFCALGAFAPTFALLTASQAVGRPLGIALDLLIAVVAAEEMPRNSRAYAVSVLTMAAGLGAGLCVMALRLADIGPGAWRLVYILALVWLFVAADLARRLPETGRFETHQHDRRRPPIQRRRLLALGAAAFAGNLFVAPASFFQNRYLDEVRGYSGGGIALFTLVTATPAGLGILVGGRIADRHGRRVLGAVSVVVGTAFIVVGFGVDGWWMWISTLLGGIVLGAAVPALGVYRSELFPTGDRSIAGYMITVSALIGGSIAVLMTGPLLDRGYSHWEILGTFALGQLVVAAIVILAFPESAHRELEELNPEDASGSTAVVTAESDAP
jgi:MFS family permease